MMDLEHNTANQIISFSRDIKIFVTGDPGAGKSTITKAIHEHFEIPAFHSDLFMYKDCASFSSYEHYKKCLGEFLEKNKNCYIIEGTVFGDDPEIFNNLVKDADVILNFTISPKATMDGFFKRINDYKEVGAAHEGLNMGSKYGSDEQIKFFLKVFAKYIDEKKELQDKISNVADKVITIKSFTDADRVLVNVKGGSCIKNEKDITFLFDLQQRC